MSVPAFVPAKVPASPGRPGTSVARGAPRYLTGSPSGWRFQMRLPQNLIAADFRLAGSQHIVRAQIGARSRADAKVLAGQFAALCQTIFAVAVDIRNTTPMSMQALDPSETALVQQVVDACENAIKQAMAQPSRAVGLAKGFGAALASLQLIQSEAAKGSGGASVITGNAEELTRHALNEVLQVASRPDDARAALAAVSNAAPPAPSTRPKQDGPPPAQAHPSNPPLPLFSAISQAYIDMRIARDGETHADISILKLRRHVFLEAIGDRTPNEYFASDLQAFVNRLQHWPANVTKRADIAGKSVLEILAANKTLAMKPMAKKTMEDGYVANVRTMMRHGMQDHHYRDPFAGAKVTYPATLIPSRPREAISAHVTNQVFENGIAAGFLDEAMLPALAKLTSRRLGLLTYLRADDIRQKDGVWIAQTGGIVEIKDETTGKVEWRRVPIKTQESMTFYVLHNYLDEIGFIAWMRAQPGFVFAAAHEHPNPSKYMSKVMQNLLRRSGAKGGEVFHSLRGGRIQDMREAEVGGRARRLQAGHELGDEHEKYGFRALTAADQRRLADLPLPGGIDWSVFSGLDFDAMAKRRRSRGRRSHHGG